MRMYYRTPPPPPTNRHPRIHTSDILLRAKVPTIYKHQYATCTFMQSALYCTNLYPL